MGWSVWGSEPNKIEETTIISKRKQIIFALSVSLLNPHALLDTIGVIGTSSLVYHGMDKVIFTITCVFVSWCWFFLLGIAGKMVGKIDNEGSILKVINKISAIIIWGVAIYIGTQIIHMLI